MKVSNSTISQQQISSSGRINHLACMAEQL
jgi:hypothetical protein